MKFNRTTLLLLLLVSLTIGIISDYSFTDKIFGLNFTVWVSSWVVYGLVIGQKRKTLGRRQLSYVLLALASAVLVYVRIEPIVQFWLALISLICIGNLYSSIVIRKSGELTLTQRWIELMSEYFRSIGAIRGLTKTSSPLRIQWRWVVSGVMAVVFIVLFSSSDSVFGSGFTWFNNLMNSVSDWLSRFDFAQLIRLIFWTTVSLLAVLLLLKPSIKVVLNNVSLTKIVKPKDRLTILLPLLVIFAVYIVVQLVYLFGNASLPDGMSYAEYARSGYGELILATIIATGIVYATKRMSTDQDVRADRVASGLLVLNLVVVASAWKRLSLYEDAYGWTMNRFIARLGLICIALGVILMIMYGVHRLSSARLFAYSWYAVAAVLIVAAILNPAGLIAAKNIQDSHAREVPLDTVYLLNELSADSYQAICNNLDVVKENDREKYAEILNRRAIGTSMMGGDEYYIDARVDLDNKQNQGISRHWVYTESFKNSASCFNY